MHKIFDLIKIMFRIGCIGFGGGSALIPVLEKEAVTRKNVVSKEEFDKYTIVASITPGALPVEIASGIGYTAAGEAGMIAASVSMALPGAIFTILLLTVFSKIEAQILEKVNILAGLISLFIIYLLLHYIGNVILQSKKEHRLSAVLGIIVCVFLLNAGKEIYQLFGISTTPLFDLSSIQLMEMAFFLILFLTERPKWYKVLSASILCLIYILCTGKSELLSLPWLKTAVKSLMAILGGYGLTASLIETFCMHKDSAAIKGISRPLQKIGQTLLIWLLILILLCLPALLTNSEALPYIERGLLSSVLSFGGGDAYLSVAEGLFVNTGMISEALFYGQLVTIVNILPGSILCKTLSGAGYLIGYGLSSSIGVGLLMALAGFGVSVFGSCSVFMSVLHAYSALENMHIFKAIGQWIRPVISGLLLSICLSLLKNVINVAIALF